MENYEKQCETFSKFGFIYPPLDKKDFYKVKKAGLLGQAYNIGCDLYCGAFDAVDEAIGWYINNA